MDQVAALPPGLVNFTQICDGPVTYGRSDDSLIRVARGERLMPGDGGIDLTALCAAIPDGTPLAVEVANLRSLDNSTPLERAKLAHDRMRAVLIDAGRA